MRKAPLLLLSMLLTQFLLAQTSNISGVVNNVYTSVNSVSAISNSANVNSLAGFAIGDTVLLIQMQGAAISTPNSASFGDITTMNNAGNYELNIICQLDVPGSNVIFQNLMTKSFDSGSSAGLQLIRVPTFQNVIVNGTLSADPWNGSTGGVLVVQARGWMRLLPGTCVMMDQTGFRGGDHDIIPDGCGCAFSGDPIFPDYFYPGSSEFGAHKGEGISGYEAGRENGRGKNSTGGGGGNDHNAGGGGGSNFGQGGLGGIPCAIRSCFFGQYCRGNFPGIGAVGLNAQYSNANNKIFLGGGAGAGDDNGGAGSGGGRGAGIVILLADSLNPFAANIYVRGQQAGTGAGDGVGGGGAGGTVLISTRSMHSGFPLNVHVQGGNGGNSSWSSAASVYNSKGKGGGGGGGVFWYSGGIVPGNVTVNSAGGPPGSELAASCLGNTGGALAGGNGMTLTNLLFQAGNTPFGSCILPVAYGFITAEKTGNMVKVDWQTFSESNNSHFEVQHSSNGTEFVDKGFVNSHGNSGGFYSFVDNEPTSGVNFYRLRQVDLDGNSSFSKVLAVSFADGEIILTSIFPNPIQSSDYINLELSLPAGQTGEITVLNPYGKAVFQKGLKASDIEGGIQKISTQGWAGGIYFIKVTSGISSQVVRRIVVMD